MELAVERLLRVCFSLELNFFLDIYQVNCRVYITEFSLYKGGWFSVKELAENRRWNKIASTRSSHRILDIKQKMENESKQ